MTTQSFQDIAEENRKSWSQGAKELAQNLSAELDAELGMRESLGQQLIASRKSAGLTQPELAKLSGILQADINRIERGLGNPTIDTVLKLLNALDMRLTLQPKPSS